MPPSHHLLRFILLACIVFVVGLGWVLLTRKFLSTAGQDVGVFVLAFVAFVTFVIREDLGGREALLTFVGIAGAPGLLLAGIRVVAPAGDDHRLASSARELARRVIDALDDLPCSASRS